MRESKSSIPRSHPPDQLRLAESNSVGSNMFYLEPVSTETPASPTKKSALDYFYLVLHRKLLLLVCILAGLAGGIAITLRQTPMYQTRATIEIRAIRTGSSYLGSEDKQTSDQDTDLETQMRVLESDTLNARVAARMLREYPNRVYRARDVFADWRAALHLPERKNQLATTTVPPVQVTIDMVGSSRIVEIVCISWDPEAAKDYANTLASEYLDYNTERLLTSTSRVGSWLSQQVQDAREQLEKSEHQLQAYAQEQNLVYTGQEQEESAEHKKLRDLQGDLDKATAERMLKQSIYEVAKASPIDAVPEVLNSTRISDLRVKLEELQRTYAELSAVYKDSYPKVASVLAQIREVNVALDRERQSIVGRIQNEYKQAGNVEQMLAGAYQLQLPKASDTERKGISYGLMKWEVDTNRKIYEELLQRVKAMTIGSSLQADSSSMLDLASLPNRPFEPNVSRNVLMGGAAGLMLGVLIALLIESVNHSLKAPGELEFHLGIPELGVIPLLSSLDMQTKPPKLLFNGAQASNGIHSNGSKVDVITWEAPPIMAEAYRNALTSILLSSSTAVARPQVILVTSSGRGEGKSSTVSNLGRALAEINQKVILIDADLRKPTLHDSFGVSNTWGLSDILREKTRLTEAPLDVLAKTTSIEGLYVLPSGPMTTNIANLFYSDRMSELVERLRTEFTTIIIDTPPISYLSDARILGRVADGAVLVVRAGVTTRDGALSAKRRLQDDGVTLLGTILNAWDGNAKSRYGYPYENYGHS
jgi:succinoglycan biosynthesis transport protein ExoP